MSPDIVAEFLMFSPLCLPACLPSSSVRPVSGSLVAAAVAAVIAGALPFAAAARGGLIIEATGMSADSPAVPLAARAEFTLSETTLRIVLSNRSPDSSTSEQMLSSFYFDVVKAGHRPRLTYDSASGLVWQARSKLPDLPVNYTPPEVAGGSGMYELADGDPTRHMPSNLLADKDNDRTWQFRLLNTEATPFLGFGVGTVGNSLFGADAGNGFTPAIVSGTGAGIGPVAIAFSIAADGEIQPVGKPMQDQYLVRDSVTFTFTSPDLAGFTEADIASHVVFGFGTGPDTIISVPEPAAVACAAAGLGLAWLARRRRRGRAGMRCARSVH